MFFYVDESGHTGPNLFDPNQPFLYYGTLSSRVNLDVLSKRYLIAMRRRLGVERLHANQLGNSGLALIADDVRTIQKKFDVRFDFYRVNKIHHAIICFFDQVFDQGMNPAVPWTSYWTPLRYMLLLRLATLFDENTLVLAWQARIHTKSSEADEKLREVCQRLLARVPHLPDERTQEIVRDALSWTITNTRDISYNVSSKFDAVTVMPNSVGFQNVLIGIAQRLRASDREAKSIVVDRQSQFNKSQTWLAKWYSRMRGSNRALGPGLPTMDLRGMPTTKIAFSSGHESSGLELVDIYLWIFKRLYERKSTAPELDPLVMRQLAVGRTDEISLDAIVERWEGYFQDAEQADLSEEQLAEGKKLMEIHEEYRREALGM